MLERMNGDELLHCLAYLENAGIYLRCGLAVPGELGSFDSKRALTHGGVERVDAKYLCVGVVGKQLLCGNIAGIYRAALLGRACNINDIAALGEVPAEYAVELIDRDLCGGDPLAAADGVVELMNIVSTPCQDSGGLYAILDCRHLCIVDVVSLEQLCGKIGAGIGDYLDFSHNSISSLTCGVHYSA